MAVMIGRSQQGGSSWFSSLVGSGCSGLPQPVRLDGHVSRKEALRKRISGRARLLALAESLGWGGNAAGQLVVLLTDLLTRRCGTGETWRDAGDGQPARWAGQAGRTQVPETLRDGGDGCRLSHNPEVAGSNPAPATSKSRSEA
jgi:hypothetical protein